MVPYILNQKKKYIKYDYEHKSFTLIFSFIDFFSQFQFPILSFSFYPYYVDKNEINNPQSACDNDLMLKLERGREGDAAC